MDKSLYCSVTKVFPTLQYKLRMSPSGKNSIPKRDTNNVPQSPIKT